MIKFAVNRSCGKASKVIFPELFFDENILQCALEGCEELKNLVLPYKNSLFRDSEEKFECIAKQIHKLKDLESLSLDSSCHVEEILAEIYIHCKKFASLTVTDDISNEEASAIVTFVPNIKQLVLSHCHLPREDLILILSGCRRLELLDVTHCIGFDAEDAEVLSKASHIKIFKSLGSVAVNSDSDSHCGYEIAL
ncbi:hypothetical protein FRX31_004888 [Thalictrum thalictroides]|uniref:F-box/LRR-repeat protein n=1 Tax=Thalictrum thalictroides TaxID=46969 RepID=A0A7J6X6Z3_THATH|nr:hypothetical protein FRX31_004888 [Thalictrum thalictroides]